MSDAVATPNCRNFRGNRGSYDECALTTRTKKPPAPGEVVTLASLPPGTIFRIVTDYDGVKDAFADRIEDIDVPLTEIDAVAGMTRGQMQKLLVKSDAKWAREFGWKTLGDALKGTGMVLAFILDDERFAPIKAQMGRRKWKRRPRK